MKKEASIHSTKAVVNIILYSISNLCKIILQFGSFKLRMEKRLEKSKTTLRPFCELTFFRRRNQGKVSMI